MQHLTPVGLSKDGRNLVLVSSSGEGEDEDSDELEDQKER